MDPIAFSVFGIDIAWYGILIVIGMLLALFVSSSLIDGSRGVTKDDFYDLALILIPIAVLTTRLYYVIFYDLEYYLQNPSQILNFRQGGLAIHGGIIGGLIVGYIWTKKKDVSFFYMTDIIAPGLALAQSIGRWGNFINQEAYGTPTDLPWAITIDGTKVHPTFLYESIITFSIFVFLYFYLSKRKKFDGQMFSIYMVVYSIGRFFIEGLRIDSLYFGPFRVAQLMSILGIIIGIIIYKVQSKKKIKN